MPRPESRYRPGQRPRATRRLAIAGTAAAVVLGGAAAAHAADSPSPSASASASASAPSSGSAASKRPAPPAPHPHLDGVVIARSGSQITITDPEGFRRTLRVTGSTRYTDGLTSAVAVGTRIHAEGAVDADHTTLDATSIGTAPTPPAGGPDAGPRRGPVGPPDPVAGGPAGAPGGPKPPAAPSPKPTASSSPSAASRS